LLDKGVHRLAPDALHVYPNNSRSALFGSGYAGLGTADQELIRDEHEHSQPNRDRIRDRYQAAQVDHVH